MDQTGGGAASGGLRSFSPIHFFGVRPLDALIDASLRPGVQPVQSLLQLRDRQRVLPALELAGLEEADAIGAGGNHRLDKGAIRLKPVRPPAKRTVLPVDLQAHAADRAAGGIAVLVQRVAGLVGSKNVRRVDCAQPTSSAQ